MSLLANTIETPLAKSWIPNPDPNYVNSDPHD